MVAESIEALKQACAGAVRWAEGKAVVEDEDRLRRTCVDTLIDTAVFSADAEAKQAARWLIRSAGEALGIYSASIHPLYEAMGRGEAAGFTVPAINIRALTYDTAQAVLRAAVKGGVGPILFEIARSEIGYTFQRPAEYICAVTAAAIKTGYRGPLFLQGDHFQVIARRYAADPEKELKAVKDLIWEALEAGFYNIDIDTSTLVDLSQPTLKEQQKLNYGLAAELTNMIRDLEPAGVTVSVGGEIGEVGKKNSTVEELRAFMDGYLETLQAYGENRKGISKISVQTGTTHGGVPLPDGTVAQVKIDFDTLERLSAEARGAYGLAGAVQHGASTLPNTAFDRFPAVKTAEIHLATGFQNMVYDSPNLPAAIREAIYAYLKKDFIAEKKETDTEEQFLYKTRKQGFGPFKRELWEMPEANRRALGEELEKQFAFLFDKLKVLGTREVLDRWVRPVAVPLPIPKGLAG